MTDQTRMKFKVNGKRTCAVSNLHGLPYFFQQNTKMQCIIELRKKILS